MFELDLLTELPGLLTVLRIPALHVLLKPSASITSHPPPIIQYIYLHVLPHVGLHYLLCCPFKLLAAVPDVLLHTGHVVVLGPGVFVLEMSSTNLTRLLSSTSSVVTVVSVVSVVSLPFLPALDDFLLMEMFVVPSVTVLVSFLVLGVMAVILQLDKLELDCLSC